MLGFMIGLFVGAFIGVCDCKVTIYFSKNRNNHVERNILENLLDTFENRMKSQIGC